jgi:hypothetical protein
MQLATRAPEDRLWYGMKIVVILDQVRRTTRGQAITPNLLVWHGQPCHNYVGRERRKRRSITIQEPHLKLISPNVERLRWANARGRNSRFVGGGEDHLSMVTAE